MTNITPAAVVSAIFDAYGAAVARRSADDAYSAAFRTATVAVGQAIASGTSANSILTAAQAKAKAIGMTKADRASDDAKACLPLSSGAMGYFQRFGAFAILTGADGLSPFAATAAIRYLCQEAPGGKATVDAILTTDDPDAATALSALRREEQKARQAANVKAAEEKAAAKQKAEEEKAAKAAATTTDAPADDAPADDAPTAPATDDAPAPAPVATDDAPAPSRMAAILAMVREAVTSPLSADDVRMAEEAVSLLSGAAADAVAMADTLQDA